VLAIDGGQPVDDHEDGLHRARQAYAAQDWRGAAASFDAVPPHRLTADDLAAYAEAVWWLGRVEDALRLDAAACDALVAVSRPADAAGVAFRLGVSTFREVTSRRAWAGSAVLNICLRVSGSAGCMGFCCC
jgi:hypothetical protein